MSDTVCLLARTMSTPTAGGHTWVYLNWALGFLALGCDVVWLEIVSADDAPSVVRARLHALTKRLAPFGLDHAIALCDEHGEALPASVGENNLVLDQAAEADLLVDISYGPADIIDRFRRTALLDIDPGLCQLWVSRGQMALPRHDVYFTIGETVGRHDALFPDCGVRWQHTMPSVALPHWPVNPANDDAPFTTVSNWIMLDYWVPDDNGGYSNDKRAGFQPFLDLPGRTNVPLELALSLGRADEERKDLERRGWRVREAHDTVAGPLEYRRYIQASRGEFSCAKPSCERLQNAWVSDRTLCYLASGKPAIVQHTGASRFLPDAEGLFRFSTLSEAAQHLETAVADYEHHCRSARALAEEYFDARKVAARFLEQALM